MMVSIERLVLDDARKFIFPLFTVLADGNNIYLQSRQFLGTAFFVTRCGDALTAAHLLPSPDEIQPNRRLIAVVLGDDGREQICWVNRAAKLADFDAALLKINLDRTSYLPTTTAQISPGEDVLCIGIPNHEVGAAGKEMRILKGHVCLLGRMRLELNFAIPAGMSGSPLFVGAAVAGYAVGSVRSEELEDATESVEEVTPTKEIIRITEIRRALYYGLARPFSALAHVRDPVFQGQTIFEFIAGRNGEIAES